MLNPLSSIYWNPPKDIFTFPFIDRPVAWYGILFVTGFIFGYFIILKVFTRFLKEPNNLPPGKNVNEMATKLTDTFTSFTILGTLVGARLGDVFFYHWDYFKNHPLDIFKVWEGGLASHGGTLGILLSIFLFSLYVKKQVPTLTFIRLIDFFAIPTALVGFFIRLGNFVNQEILGTPSSLPWAVIFGNPLDRSAPIPRHPVQLYEAFSYLVIFCIIFTLWRKKGPELTQGMLSGLLLILVFTSRFFLEFWKATQASFIDPYLPIQMGQLLSIPFIFLGFFLIWYGKQSDTLLLHTNNA